VSGLAKRKSAVPEIVHSPKKISFIIQINASTRIAERQTHQTQCA
jgi:hypothetical protein